MGDASAVAESSGEWPEQGDLRDDLEAVHGWGDAHPEKFGGMWFENLDETASTTRSRIVIALVGGDDAHREDLRRVVQHPAALRFVEHRWTYGELRQLQDQFSDYLFNLRPDDGSDAHVSGLGVDVVENCLQVTLSAPSSALRRDVLAIAPGRVKIADRYAVFRAF
jgi:hypothetical protein